MCVVRTLKCISTAIINSVGMRVSGFYGASVWFVVVEDHKKIWKIHVHFMNAYRNDTDTLEICSNGISGTS